VKSHAVGVMMKRTMIMTDKYFNTTNYKKKERLMNLFVWVVLGFAVLGVMASFSFALNLIWRLIQ
jgi:hypothetical protein